METLSALLAICAGNSPVPGEFPAQSQWRGALRFSLICVWINGRVKKSWGWWFQMLSRPLWRHRNDMAGENRWKQRVVNILTLSSVAGLEVGLPITCDITNDYNVGIMAYVGFNDGRWDRQVFTWGRGSHPSFMMTSSNGNICRVMAICAGNSPVPGEFPTQRPVTRSFDVFFDLRLNKRLSQQSRGW